MLAGLHRHRYVRLVTDLSTQSQPVPFRLRLFGPPALLRANDDTLLGTHGHHRRRLALLAVLAAAGERGRSRDQMLLLFWPEVTQARARHSLDQLLYALRGSIAESVFEGTNPLRLNPTVVASDVGTFAAAIQRGDLEVAVDAYHGPFLDGFYLSDAPEFEEWAESERSRLARSYASALDRLAEDAGVAGDNGTIVRRRRQLAELDPTNGRNAAELIRALMNAGDHAAALQHAKRYDTVVTRELGISAGPEIASLVEEVQARTRVPLTAASDARPVATGAPESKREAMQTSGLPVEAPLPVVEPMRSRSTRQRSARYAMGAMGALVVMAMALWGRPTTGDGASPTSPAPSVAVLPFANLSGDPKDGALIDGLSEELMSVLSKIDHLRVIPPVSAFAFKNSDAGTRRIADSLGVSHVLESTFQKVGSRIRVRTSLIAAGDGSTRWSKRYDREMVDVFELQDDIARSVAGELGVRLGRAGKGPLRRVPTRNVAAYELYLRASDRALFRNDSTARVALQYFQEAVALDSTFALGWAGLARTYGRVGSAAPLSERDRYYALAEESARKAVAIDDSLAEAYATLGLVRMSVFDFAAAERHLRHAVALDPEAALPHEWMVSLDLWAGRAEGALAHAERALELDPLSPYAHAEVARALLGNDRCDEAFPFLDKLSGLEPPLPRGAVIAAQCYARKERWPEAIAAMGPTVERGPRATLGMLGYLLARAGRREDAMRVMDTLVARRDRGAGGAFEIGLVYAGLGDFEESIDWLDRAIDDRSFLGNPGNPAHVAIMGPLFEELRRHPDFERLRERLRPQKR